MKILISGFEKFGPHSINTSEVMLKLLESEPHIKTVLLPVTFQDAFEKLNEEIQNHRPEVVIALGLAASRDKISLEKVAINLIDCEIPDNAGVFHRDTPIIQNAPNAYFSTLPLTEMLAASGTFPTEISYSAGAYVCNYLMYQLLHSLEGSGIKSGFIHLPNLNDNQNQILSSLQSMIKVL